MGAKKHDPAKAPQEQDAATILARTVDEIDGVARMIEAFANDHLDENRAHTAVVGGALAIQRSVQALWTALGPDLLK